MKASLHSVISITIQPNGDNWYAVNDPRGLAPEGWHIPSEVEWKMLNGFLGGDKLASIKMKSITGWNCVEELDVLGEPTGKILNGNGTNESGFSGLPGGSRQLDFDNFYNLGYNSYWWSSTEVHSNDAYCHSLENYSDWFENHGNYNKKDGLSVRCLKD